MKEYNPIEIEILIDRLGIEYNRKKISDNGDVKIIAPQREEKNPSFCLKLKKGIFYDFGTGWSGNIFELIKEMRNCDFSAAKKWADEQLGYADQSQSQKPPSFSSSSDTSRPEEGNSFGYVDDTVSDPLTDDQWFRIKEVQGNLENIQDIDFVRSYDLLDKETLQHFNCGWGEYRDEEWLFMPYKTGCQRYRTVRKNFFRSMWIAMKQLRFISTAMTMMQDEPRSNSPRT